MTELFVAIVVFCSSTGGNLGGMVEKTDASACIDRVYGCLNNTPSPDKLSGCFAKEASGTLSKWVHGVKIRKGK